MFNTIFLGGKVLKTIHQNFKYFLYKQNMVWKFLEVRHMVIRKYI